MKNGQGSLNKPLSQSLQKQGKDLSFNKTLSILIQNIFYLNKIL